MAKPAEGIGSWRQNCELTNRNVIEGRDPWDELAQHNKILWFKGHGKWRSCAVKVHSLIWGGLGLPLINLVSCDAGCVLSLGGGSTPALGSQL